ncbi:MAG: hypothetical protein H7308_06420 [Chthonomonadaceae bacterium]|nr:hypothetical protein [Chthonomonadaceae bacterium]
MVPHEPLTEQQIEAMVTEINPKGRLFREVPTWLFAPLIGGLVGAASVGFIAKFGLRVLPYFIVPFPLFTGLAVWGLYYAYRVVPNRLKKKGRREILNKIEATHDVRFIAPLIDLWIGDKRANYALIYEIIQTLTPLLSFLTPENAEALPSAQRKRLYLLIKMTPGNLSKIQEKMCGELVTDCMVEVIQALTRIGDTGALPAMRSLLKLKGGTDWHIRVRDTVQQCLPKLELIAKEETNAKILLRPSTFEDRTGETLLRPISLSQKDNPQTLLRAVDGQEKGEGEEN